MPREASHGAMDHPVMTASKDRLREEEEHLEILRRDEREAIDGAVVRSWFAASFYALGIVLQEAAWAVYANLPCDAAVSQAWGIKGILYFMVYFLVQNWLRSQLEYRLLVTKTRAEQEDKIRALRSYKDFYLAHLTASELNCPEYRLHSSDSRRVERRVLPSLNALDQPPTPGRYVEVHQLDVTDNVVPFPLYPCGAQKDVAEKEADALQLRCNVQCALCFLVTAVTVVGIPVYFCL